MFGRLMSILTLLVAVLAALTVGSPAAERRSDEQSRLIDSTKDIIVVETREGPYYKYQFDCSFTRQCPPCEVWAKPGHIQCCWPSTTASPFEGPGYCLCAPQKSTFEFANSCLGGHWVS